jgi:hypothetical protein
MFHNATFSTTEYFTFSSFLPFFCFIPNQSTCDRCRPTLFHHMAICGQVLHAKPWANYMLSLSYKYISQKHDSNARSVRAVGMYALWLMSGTLHLNTPFSQHKNRRPCTVSGQWFCAHLTSHSLVTANEYLIPGSDDLRWYPACSLPRITKIKRLVF